MYFCVNAAGRCALIQQPRKLISTRKLDFTLATTRSQSSLIKSDQDNNWQNQGGNQYWMLSKEGEIRRDEACFDYSGKEVLSFFCDFFYRTWVRSLSILVSNSLTHSFLVDLTGLTLGDEDTFTHGYSASLWSSLGNVGKLQCTPF